MDNENAHELSQIVESKDAEDNGKEKVSSADDAEKSEKTMEEREEEKMDVDSEVTDSKVEVDNTSSEKEGEKIEEDLNVKDSTEENDRIASTEKEGEEDRNMDVDSDVKVSEEQESNADEMEHDDDGEKDVDRDLMEKADTDMHDEKKGEKEGLEGTNENNSSMKMDAKNDNEENSTKEVSEELAEVKSKSESDDDNSEGASSQSEDSKMKDSSDKKDEEKLKSDDKPESALEEKGDKENLKKFDDRDEKDVNEKDTDKENESAEKADDKEKAVSSEDGEKVKSVEKVTDEDGTDIIITMNEDNSDDEHADGPKENNENKSDEKPKEATPKKDNKKPVKSTFENDVVIVDLSAESPKDEKPPARTPVASVPSKPNFGSTTNTPITVKAPVLSSSNVVVVNGQQYIQQIMYDVNGRKQIVQVPVTAGNKHLYSHMLSQAAAQVTTAKTVTPAPPPKPETGLKRFKIIYDDIPIASWEQLDLIKYEWNTKKYDNTFWAGQCPINKKAELSTPAKFLLDLGSDIVKKSAYTQIVTVQTRKDKEGKLGKPEQENLSKMKKIVHELKEKLEYIELKQKKCDGCNFSTESENVMMFHKEHPHMDPPMDPYGDMICSNADCRYKCRNPEAFAYHMEKNHKMKARVFDKPEIHKCSLCYFESKAKRQLTTHKFKCMKQFKAILNQCPHYTDINYCLKNIFYKYQVKKPPPPPAPVKSIAPRIIRQPAPQLGFRKSFTHGEQYRPPIIRPKNAPSRTAFIPVSAAPQQIMVGTPGTQYRPIGTVGAFSNMPIQFVQGIPVMNTTIASPSTVPARPTVNQLLKNKTQKAMAPKPAANTPTSDGSKSSFEVCEICGGYVKDRMSLRIHFFYAHKVDMPAALFNRGIPPLFCEVCKVSFWTSQGLTKHKFSLKHFPQPNAAGKNMAAKPIPKCWICQQAPDNLYSHIHKFHRMSTSECMALRRCMFCGIQSNTRRDLEVHMAAAHGVLIKGDNNNSGGNAKVATKTSTPGLVRNNFCVFCSKQFPDNTQLTLHCLRDHATCSSCGMVVASTDQLRSHICKNAPSKKCEICGIKNLKPQYYTKHVKTHLKKLKIKLRRLTDKEIEDAMGKERKLEMDMQKQREEFMKMEADIWNEIESRRKRDKEEEELNKDPEAKKRKLEEVLEEKIKKKMRKLEDRDSDYTPNEEDEVVVLD